MSYIFDIFLTEQDYIEFNTFHATRAPYGKRIQRGLRGMIAVMFSLGAIFRFWAEGVTLETVIYALLLVVFGLLISALLGKTIAVSVKHTVRSLKKSGKMAFSPESRVGFTDEGVLEITPDGRTEKRWESIERLCIDFQAKFLKAEDMNNSAAFVLPVEQLRAQTDLAEFRKYLESKVPVVDVFTK